ncbi:hypothetical protein F5Y19DRAFT_470686 [Xylariaceae sp. FL1651]|nr:hypothetical protein F5Y19DRAFT_470686 [Xylariaceae sp. FL1651]
MASFLVSRLLTGGSSNPMDFQPWMQRGYPKIQGLSYPHFKMVHNQPMPNKGLATCGIDRLCVESEQEKAKAEELKVSLGHTYARQITLIDRTDIEAAEFYCAVSPASGTRLIDTAARAQLFSQSSTVRANDAVDVLQSASNAQV